MKRLHRGFTLVELLIVCTIVGLLAAMAIPTIYKIRSQKGQPPSYEYYQAWVKVYHRPDITYKEWYVLYLNHALPTDRNLFSTAGPPLEHE